MQSNEKLTADYVVLYDSNGRSYEGRFKACYMQQEDGLVLFKGQGNEVVFAVHRDRIISATRTAQ